MPEISLVAVAAATLAAFLIGGAYYGVFGSRLASLSPAATAAAAPWTYAAELGRCLVLATVFVGLAEQAAIEGAGGGLLLGLALWIGFPLVLWTGAVVHERTPVGLAAIHAGDWLVKLLALGVLAGVLA